MIFWSLIQCAGSEIPLPRSNEIFSAVLWAEVGDIEWFSRSRGFIAFYYFRGTVSCDELYGKKEREFKEKDIGGQTRAERSSKVRRSDIKREGGREAEWNRILSVISLRTHIYPAVSHGRLFHIRSLARSTFNVWNSNLDQHFGCRGKQQTKSKREREREQRIRIPKQISRMRDAAARGFFPLRVVNAYTWRRDTSIYYSGQCYDELHRCRSFSESLVKMQHLIKIQFTRSSNYSVVIVR